jgi:hypothetical protein
MNVTAGSTRDLTVFIARRDVVCGKCGEELGRYAWNARARRASPPAIIHPGTAGRAAAGGAG